MYRTGVGFPGIKFCKYYRSNILHPCKDNLWTLNPDDSNAGILSKQNMPIRHLRSTKLQVNTNPKVMAKIGELT